MGCYGKPVFRKIRDPIGVQIQDGNGLMGQILLRAEAIVQKRGVSSVWAQSNGRGKPFTDPIRPGAGEVMNLLVGSAI